MMINIFYSLIVLSIIHLSFEYSDGAPIESCSDLFPYHNATTQVIPSPYIVKINSTLADNSATLIFSIEAVNQWYFEGFMVQARNTITNDIIGSFVSNAHVLLNCSNAFDTITQSDSKKKRSVNLYWKVPSLSANTNVTFFYTVLKSEKIFWSMKSYDSFLLSEFNLPSSAFVAEPKTNSDELNMYVNPLISFYDECEITKGCFGYEPNCVNTKNCSIVVSYSLYKSGDIVMELRGIADFKDYLAVGLSYDSSMNDDFVIYCTSQHIGAGYTSQKVVFTDDEYISFIHNLQIKYVNSILFCKFSIEKRIKFDLLKTKFDLLQDPFYLLLARGIAEFSHPFKPKYHFSKRVSSSKSIHLTSINIPSPSNNFLLRLHGSLMSIAWLGTAAIGILLPRYFKNLMGQKLFGLQLWFQMHRFLMMCTSICTVLATIAVFWFFGGWTTTPVFSARGSLHPVVGAATIILTFIQIFIAVSRPPINSSRRPIFNWTHWFIGNLAHLLALISVILSFKLVGLPFWIYYVLGFYVLLYAFMHIILSINQCCCGESLLFDGKNSNEIYPMQQVEVSNAYLTENHDKQNNDFISSNSINVIFFIYVIFISIFVIFIALMILKPFYVM